MKHYVYALIDPRNERVFYIGKGKGERCLDHLKMAVKGIRHNLKLQNKIRKILKKGGSYGVDYVFSSENEAECFKKECEWIAFHGRSVLCNLTDGGEGASGAKRSNETKKKMSVISKARIFSEETRKKMSLSAIGNKNSSTAFLGRKHTEETKRKMSMSGKGRIASQETREKNRQATLRQFAIHGHPSLGRKRSEETKRRMSNTCNGRKLSKETKKKIGEALRKGRYAKVGMAACCAMMLFASVDRSSAYILVEDLPALGNNIVNEAKNYASYLQQEANQVTQITNQISQIENQVVALERFGNPQTYVNMLGLGQLLASSAVLVGGIGETISAYRQAANGVMALRYTGNGLYSNLTGMVDRFGNPVRFDPNAFRKFSAVNDMVDAYGTQQQVYNAQMASLQRQLADAYHGLDSDSTQMGTAKRHAQIDAIAAEINALGHTSQLSGQRIQAQMFSNQNDAARTQEASRQQELQERQTDLQNEASGLGRFIGGGTQK